MLTKIRADLYETQGENPFPGLTTHAYLWTPASGGNVLFYSPVSDVDFEEIERLGGVAHQYLSHEDEAGPMLRRVAERFGARLHAPRGDAEQISKVAEVHEWLAERGADGNAVEVVPTPGHTPGSTSYVVTGVGGERYLFTGDTVFTGGDGSWAAGNLPFSDQVALAGSVRLLGTLRPDLVASSAAPGPAGVHEMTDAVWTEAMREVAAGLEA
jgi:hypothetical protein